MNTVPSPYAMSTHSTASHMAHRTSRSSASQSGAHPYRVEKPKSNHNSPRTVERRKTTTGVKLYATLDDHYNMMMGITSDDEAVESTPAPTPARPMSWHPSSNQFSAQRSSTVPGQVPSQNGSRHYSISSRASAQGSDFYSLSSRDSAYADSTPAYPYQADGYFAHHHHHGSQESDCGSQAQQAYAQSTYSTPATEVMPWYLQQWARQNQDETSASQNGSSEFLPIQHPSAPQEDEPMEDSGKELVGMGLYDLPEPSLDWSPSLVEATGKGLKLEETWQPPEEDDDEDEEEEEEEEEDDEQEADDTSSDDGEEELPPPPPPKQEPSQIKAPVVSIRPQPTGNLQGQSFFFDEDDSTVTKEWWYQPLKQPAAIPVQDTGYGYGWL